MRLIRAALLCLVAVALSMPASAAGRELRMGSKDIPTKIREAAEAAVPGISLDAVKLGRTKDGIVYEVGGVAEGKRYEIEINTAGEVLEVEESNGIALTEVPEAAKKAALEAVPGAKLVEAELMPSKGGTSVYELEVLKKDGKTFEVLVSAKGEVKKVTEDTDDKDDDD